MQTYLSLHFSGLGICVWFIVRFQQSFSKFLTAPSTRSNVLSKYGLSINMLVSITAMGCLAAFFFCLFLY